MKAVTVHRGGTRTHLWYRGDEKTLCGLPVEPGYYASETAEPTCRRCAPHWELEGGKEATTTAREYLPDSEAGRRRTKTRQRAGRLLFGLYGLKSFSLVSNEDTFVGAGLAAIEAGTDPEAIAGALERVNIRG